MTFLSLYCVDMVSLVVFGNQWLRCFRGKFRVVDLEIFLLFFREKCLYIDNELILGVIQNVIQNGYCIVYLIFNGYVRCKKFLVGVIV